MLEIKKHLTISRNTYYLLAIILVGAVLRAMFFSGYQSGDDAAYIARAFVYSEGSFLPPYSHWGARILPVALTAFSFSIFGVNDFAIALFPFIFSIGGIGVAYLIGRLVADEQVGLLSAFFVTIFPMEVLFSSQLFPYSYLSFLCSLSLLFFLNGENKYHLKWYLLSGMVLGLAYLSRITALYSLLFFAFYAIWQRDLFHRKYVALASGLIAVMVIEAAIGIAQSGDLLQRLHILTGLKEEASEIGRKTNFVPNIQWFIEPIIRPIVEQEIGAFFLVLLPTVIYQLVWGKNKGITTLLLWIIPVFLYISYGTTSPFEYSPLRRLPRYLAPIIIPAMVVIAYQLWRFRSRTVVALIGTGLITFSLFALVIDNSRYVVEQERALASHIAKNPEKKYVIPRSIYYDLLYFNQFSIPENVVMYVNSNDVSDTLKRIRIVSSNHRETSSLATACGILTISQGDYISENLSEDPSFVLVKTFFETERLYNKLKRSKVAMQALKFVRDDKRMEKLKNYQSKELKIFRKQC